MNRYDIRIRFSLFGDWELLKFISPSPHQAVESLYSVLYLRSWGYMFKNFHQIFTGSHEISSKAFYKLAKTKNFD